MSSTKDNFLLGDRVDSIDEYFECVTACSVDDKGVECVTECVEVHLKGEEGQ